MVELRSNPALPGVALISSEMDFPGLEAAFWAYKLLVWDFWTPGAGPSAHFLTRDDREYVLVLHYKHGGQPFQ